MTVDIVPRWLDAAGRPVPASTAAPHTLPRPAPPPSATRTPAPLTPFQAERQRVEYWLEIMRVAGLTNPSPGQVLLLDQALGKGLARTLDAEAVQRFVDVYVSLLRSRGTMPQQGTEARGLRPVDTAILAHVDALTRQFGVFREAAAAVEVAASVAAEMAARIDLIRLTRGLELDPAMVLLLLAAHHQPRV